MGAFAEGALINQFTSTVASGGTLTLTVSSTTWQRITGTTTHTVTLPDATTMRRGREFVISNESTGDVTVNFNGGALAATVAPGRQRVYRLFANGTAAGTWTVTDQIDVFGPLSIHETIGGADDKLNIQPNQITASDNSITSTPPIDDIINAFSAGVVSTIDFQTPGSDTGGTTGGTFQTDGGTFTRPAVASGQFTRMVMVYKSADNVIDTSFAAAAASQGALTNAGTLFAALDGVPIGYIDLESTGASDYTFKTPGAATNIIESSGITRFGSGSSAGAAGDTSFKAQSISSNVIKIKKGFLLLDDGRELVTYDGANNNVDLDFNLKTATNTLGVTAPSASTVYYLYLDLSFLPASTVTVGDVDRVAYQAQSGTTGIFTVLASTPENTDTSRYVPLAVLKTDGSSDYTEFEDLARRRHDRASVAISPLVGTPLDGVSIGSVGAVANQQAALAAGDFSGGTASFFHLTADGTDDSANSNDLTNNGSTAFNGKGFYGSEDIANLDGTDDYLSSTAAHFNPGNGVNVSMGAWVKSNWDANMSVISNWGSSDNVYRIIILATGTIRFSATNTGATADFEIDVPTNFSGTNSWHHLAMIYDFSTTTVFCYIDGQVVGSGSLTNLRSASTSNFTIGAEDGTVFYLQGLVQDAFFVNGDALSAAEVNAIYSRRFKAGALNTDNQLTGGHILTADSFPCTSLTSRGVFYNLAADSDDDSGNGLNLTNTGSTPFTGLNIFGTAAAAELDGSTQYFTSTDSFFDIDPATQDYAAGGWFAFDDWTPSATELALTLRDSSDTIFAIRILSTGVIDVDGDASVIAVASDPGFIDGSWHHIAISAIGGTLTLYLDGVSVATGDATLGAAAASPTFGVGTFIPASFQMAGRIQDVFFFKDTQFTDDDITKIVSTRIDLTGTAASVGCSNQIWEATFEREDSKIKNQLSAGWLLDQKDDKIYADFGDASGDCITLKLYDGGLGVTTAPSKCYDKTFTATPGATLVHNLPATPTSVTVLHDDLAAGQFQVLDASSHIKVDGTNIYTAGFGVLTIDATHPLRIIACAGAPAIGTGASSGGAGWNVVVISSAYTAAVQDDVLVDTSGGTITVTLPASPTAGDKVKVTDGYSNAATNNITCARNGNLIDAAAADFVINTDSVWTEFVYMDATRGWVTRI